MQPQYLVAMVPTETGILLMDVLRTGPLEHWLVPEWLEWPDEGMQTPARAIRVEGLAFQPFGIGQADLTVSTQVPTDVLFGRSRLVEGREVEVIEGPSSRFGKLPMRTTN